MRSRDLPGCLLGAIILLLATVVCAYGDNLVKPPVFSGQTIGGLLILAIGGSIAWMLIPKGESP